MNVLNFINHKQFDATFLKIQHEFHEENFFVVALDVGLPAFQQHAPQERPGRVLTDGSLDANDRNTIALLLNHWRGVGNYAAQGGGLAPACTSTPHEIARV